jgi:hypothetical protein
MNVIERAKRICLAPAAEWLVIAPEITTMPDLYKSYVMLLAAIGPIASFIGFSVVGTSMGFGGYFRVPILFGLMTAIVMYVLSLVSVWIISLIINGLAPNFGGEKSPMQAFKLAAYAGTPAYLAGILHIIPALGILALLASIYSLYVLYLGTMPLMRIPAPRAVGYTAVVVICTVVLMIVIGAVVGAVSSLGMGRYGPFGMMGSNSNLVVNNGNQQAAQVAAAIVAEQELAAAARQTAQIQQSQSASAAMATAAPTGNAGFASATPPALAAQVVDQNQLKALLPESLGSLPRTGFQAEKTGMATMMISRAEGDYGDAQGGHVQLVITDLGGTQMVAMMAVWANLEEDKETDAGYDKTSKINGRPVHESFQKNGSSGEYATLIDQRFLVQATGSKVDMATLQNAVNGIDAGKLAAMKNAPAKPAG